MLMRFDPFRELDRLTQSLSQSPLAPSAMPMDAYRHGDEFVINLDLPGVDPASVDVTVERNVLTVSAQRSWEPQEGDQVIASERPQGSFSRQLFLGESLDAERIAARYENGVLSVTVPVAEKVKPRRVEVSGGAEREAIGTGASAS
jgi:HSP20 family protein